MSSCKFHITAALLIVSVLTLFAANDANAARKKTHVRHHAATTASATVQTVSSRHHHRRVSRARLHQVRVAGAHHRHRWTHRGRVIAVRDGSLAVHSAAALVIDQNTGLPIYAKNERDVLPIASITKLMTALVVLDAAQPMDETVYVTQRDVDHLKLSTSRLRVGARLTRENMLRLALMASENRAASALAHAYPGGMPAFVDAMNRKAHALSMTDSRFEDATGLNSDNVSTARDLVLLVQEAWRNPYIRAYTTTASYTVPLNRTQVTFNNTNPLVKQDNWHISLSKTGFIDEAGRCLVMRATLAQKDVVIVLLNSQGKYTRIGDANRVRQWMEAHRNELPRALPPAQTPIQAFNASQAQQPVGLAQPTVSMPLILASGRVTGGHATTSIDGSNNRR